MIRTKLTDNTLIINCSKNQIIYTDRLKQLYRTGLRFVAQNGIAPVIVDAERNVKLSQNAQQLFNRLEAKCKDTTLVIISG